MEYGEHTAAGLDIVHMRENNSTRRKMQYVGLYRSIARLFWEEGFNLLQQTLQVTGPYRYMRLAVILYHVVKMRLPYGIEMSMLGPQ